MMHGTASSVFGALIIGIGTFIRVTPDLDRSVRRHFFRNYAMTRKLFELRKKVKDSDKGVNYTVYHQRVIKEFIDYVDSTDIKEPPDDFPHSIASSAACIEVEYENGDTEEFLRGGASKRTLVELLTLSIERRCRNFGLLVAFIGTGFVIAGAVL